jgi:parvulin-like peptidyl-prolyl isomerase
MARFPRLFGLFALVLALVAGACGDTVRPSAATVNGEAITQDELDDELEAIEGNEAYLAQIESGGMAVRGTGDGTISNAFVSRVLTRQILLKLVHDEFERRDLEVEDADLQNAEPSVIQSVGGEEVFNAFPKAYRDTLIRRNAEVAVLQAALGGPEVTDEAVAEFYEQNAEQFAETCVSHILFAVTDDSGGIDQEATAAAADRLTAEATAAKAEIDAGGDFAAIAARSSVDPQNKDNAGDLECGPAGRFVPEFETAMDATAVGAVSAPVTTQFGVHLIKVTDRRTQPLEEAEATIRQQLSGEGEQAFSQFLQEALADATVSVNPRYGRFSKDGQSPGIIPPDAPTTTAPGDGAGGVTEVPDPLQP